MTAKLASDREGSDSQALQLPAQLVEEQWNRSGGGMARGRHDHRSSKRAGAAVRQALHAEFLSHLNARRFRYGGFLILWLAFVAGFGAVMIALDVSEFVSGLFVGILLGALLWLGHVLYVSLGLGHRSMGADAEEWTAAELGKLDHRWEVFHDVPLARSNVDHVAIGPGRVYAIETKWTARSDVDRFLKGATWQAARQATELAAELRTRGAGREVRPLLVVWGPGMADRLGEKPQLVNKVPVVAGHHAAVWRERMTGALDRLEADRPATQALLALLAEHEAQLDAVPAAEDEPQRAPVFVDAPSTQTQVTTEP
jgi:hypothetical protein